MITALLLLALQTTPAATSASQAPASTTPTDVRVHALGGVEAPAQPEARSTSVVATSPRFTPVAAAGHAGTLTLPIGSLVNVRGQEENAVMGVGLVVGLAGTGDSLEAARRLLANYLLTRNIKVDLQTISSKNVAIVQVDASLSAGVKPGQRVDVIVSTIGDASSLHGGTLVLTELTDITGRVVYATASGPVTVGGFTAEGQGASAKRNHTTVGTLPGGGKVEREIPTRLASDHGWVHLDLRSGQDSLGNLVRLVDEINAFYPGVAEALPDGKSARVRLPEDLPETAHAAYVDSILTREIVSEDLARVVVNERTGTVVMGGNVRLRPGAIAQGGLTVTIAESPQTSQPGPFSGGTTTVTPSTDLSAEEENRALVVVPGAATLQEVVDVLNVLGTTPRDLISVLQAMAQGGLLVAEIRRM